MTGIEESLLAYTVTHCVLAGSDRHEEMVVQDKVASPGPSLP
jgi:hypothetical protein